VMRAIDWASIGMACAMCAIIALCAPGCGEGALISDTTIVHDRSAVRLPTCELRSDAPWNICPDGLPPHVTRRLDWWTDPRDDVWRASARQATAWWTRELGVEWRETWEGPGVQIGWGDVPEPYYAYAHGYVDTDCGVTHGHVRIAHGVTVTDDAPLLIHELGHVIGLAHDERVVDGQLSVMHPDYGAIQIACAD
jgi:hypothetical protein